MHKKICEYCKEGFYSKRSGARFCSQDCFKKREIAESELNSVKKPCNFCGKEVMRSPSKATTELIFCNIDCSSSYFSKSKIPLTCAFCGKYFERKPSAVKAQVSFCSPECTKRSGIMLEGSLKRVNAMYEENGGMPKKHYRNYAFRVYGKVCKICGFDEHERLLDVDHIDSNRQNNSIENLQVLCVMCHARKTRGVPFPNQIKADEIDFYMSNLQRTV